MKKTTLYLDETDAERLRCLSDETGKSQAALIREAIAGLVARGPRRAFHSMGIGQHVIRACRLGRRRSVQTGDGSRVSADGSRG
ncbi:MAG: ribbon-helix-helix protein, CopG family [Chloroflexota bacterium]